MTAALEGGEWSAARPGRTLTRGKTHYPLYRRLVGPQGRSGRAENPAPPGFDPRTVQPVVSRYTDWATRPIKDIYVFFKINYVGRSHLEQGWKNKLPQVTTEKKFFSDPEISTKYSPYHPSGTFDFKVAHIFWENMRTLVLKKPILNQLIKISFLSFVVLQYSSAYSQ